MKTIAYFLFFVGLAHIGNAADQQKIRDFWFNGAEINRYELSQSRYGDQHPGHAEFIFVTEPFLIDEQVKHEFGTGDSTDVLKLNALRTFNTGIYSYRTMTSTFRPIDFETYPHALKTTTSVQDWCGQAFQQINRRDKGWEVELNSYFQKEGDRNWNLPDATLEDELWLLVRLEPGRLPIGNFQCIPGALYTRFAHKKIEAINAVGTLETKNRERIYSVHYPSSQRTLTIHFKEAFPHIITKWTETDAGGTTTAVLKDRIMNSEYWSENHPKNSKKRKQLGLDPIAD
ncbi:MAG: septum formation inhibitor Maf [Opitutaceae bacterium]